MGTRWPYYTEEPEASTAAAMHDSGKREEFCTGAVRDASKGKPRPDLISPFFEERLGHWLRWERKSMHRETGKRAFLPSGQ